MSNIKAIFVVLFTTSKESQDYKSGAVQLYRSLVISVGVSRIAVSHII